MAKLLRFIPKQGYKRFPVLNFAVLNHFEHFFFRNPLRSYILVLVEMQNAFFQPLGFENPDYLVRVAGRGVNFKQFYEFSGDVTRFFLEFALRRFGKIFALITFPRGYLP